MASENHVEVIKIKNKAGTIQALTQKPKKYK